MKLRSIFWLLIFFILILIATKIEAASYDFGITGVSVSPSSPHVFHECTITINVKHNGEADLVDDSGIADYGLSIDNFELNSIVWTMPSAANPIKTGGSITYTIKGIFTNLGEKDLVFSLNGDKILPEVYMVDNNTSKEITVVSAEDFEVYSIELYPPYPAFNENVLITVKVKNKGKDEIVNNFGLQSRKMTIDDFDLYDEDIPWVDTRNRLLIDDFASYTYEGRFKSSGKKTARFEIDVADEVEEYNEGNNIKEVEFAIGGEIGRDVTITEFKVSSQADELVKGEEYTVTAVLKNSGDVSLVDERGLIFTDYIYSFPGLNVKSYSYPTPPTPADPLNPGELFTYAFTVVPTQIGSFTLTFSADTAKRILESNEANNSSSTRIFVYETQAKADDFDFSDIDVVKFSSSSAEISWQTSKKTAGHAELKTGHYNYNSYLDHLDISSWPASSGKTSHTVIFSKLEPGAQYVLRIVSQKGDTEKTSAETGFSMPSSDAISFVGSPVLELTQSEKKVKMTWTSDLAGTSKVYYKKTGDSAYANSGSNGYSVSHTTEVSGLSAGEYSVYAYSKTKANTEASSQIYSFSIAGDAPVVIPEEEEPTAPASPENPVQSEEKIVVKNKSMYAALKGRIILQVEANGEAYYLSPGKEEMYFLGRPDDAFRIMREQGIGITANDLKKIPIGIAELTGQDSDGDGLSDLFEDAIGTNKTLADSDSDGYTDMDEVQSGYNPNGAGPETSDVGFSNGQKGKIFLSVQQNGEAWYVNPVDGKRYFLGRPADAFAVMRRLGLGISNNDFNNLQ